MTTDLWMLAYTCLFCLALTGPAFLGTLRLDGGVAWFLGNRESPLEGPEWVGRARRAHGNLVEALAPFAALVLTAHVSGTANEMTALAATLFFGLRVLHAVVYIAGIPTLRSVVWTAGHLCLVMIFLQLLGSPP
jgi:uncharacterized MAPEG superfamily protein